MALTDEQQQDVDRQNAIEDNRSANVAAQELKRTRLETLRMAKDVLVENRRTQSASDATEITSSGITTLAADLNNYINS